jgi:hypothetical protein
MSLPSFLRFAPVAVKSRHDGWTPARQRRFVLELARGAGPDAAARLVGKTRQTAYALRRRPGAAQFAAAWDAALAFAAEASLAGGAPPEGPFETIWVPRFYRGRLVGFVRREDARAAMRTLDGLDRLAAAMDAAPEAAKTDMISVRTRP